MRRELYPLLGFAAFVAAMDVLLWSYHPTRLVGLLLLVPVVAALVAAAALALSEPARAGARVIPELSLATTLAALGCVVAGTAVIFGLWLFLIGAALALGGAFRVVRELRAGRRMAR
jgi:asparagine N-glycosylation enzyme membrane subunit Stt3